MPKNANNRPVKREEPMNGAMKFFLAGCVAELYLLVVRRFYANGTLEQVVAWDDYLKVFAGIGGIILAAGLAASFLWRADGKKRVIGWSISGAGAFLALSSLLVRAYYTSALALLSVTVPMVMLMGILWSLYDRECAMSLTVLGISLLVLWVCRKQLDSMYFGTAVKVGAIVYLALLALVAWLVKQEKLPKLLPGDADTMPVYMACGLSAAAVIIALISTADAYYAMWALGIVVFALAVYYTVKQL